ncbi:MAG: hypothetical protein IJ576_10015 [Synergistaceae bacterium]|nr:hypothetical protein [Synergistaceae bacterium]MBR1419286.1 hypothetical protein [Synergistaceae bacterium]
MAISLQEEMLTKKLACELLGLKQIEELDYYDIYHIMALSLSVHEAASRLRKQNKQEQGKSPYWEYMSECLSDIWEDDDFHIRLAEEGFDNPEYVDFSLNDYDVSVIAYFAIEDAKERLLSEVGNNDTQYWSRDYSYDIHDIVWNGQQEYS